jgi:hypothetical protein
MFRSPLYDYMTIFILFKINVNGASTIKISQWLRYLSIPLTIILARAAREPAHSNGCDTCRKTFADPCLRPSGIPIRNLYALLLPYVSATLTGHVILFHSNATTIFSELKNKDIRY